MQLTEEFAQPTHIAQGLIALFRGAFEIAPDDLKSKVAKRFVTILKEEADTSVLAYGTAFFRLRDLQYVSEDEAAMIKEHYFGRLRENVATDLLTALDGIGTHLNADDVPKFVDPLVRVICSKQPHDLRRQAQERIQDEYFSMEGNAIVGRLEDWIETFRRHGNDEYAARVEELKNYIEIPF